MKREVYQDLSRRLNLPVGSCPHVKGLQQAYAGLKHETIISIFAQENQYKVIKTNHLHKSRVLDYFRRYLAGDDLLQISADVDFPPCMLVRRMLESVLKVNKQSIGEILKAPHLLSSCVRTDIDPQLVTQLQADILRCCHADFGYSPYSDVARQAAGIEYELLLYQKLRDAGVAFWTEGDLRAQGYHKTPDARLQVPIAIRDSRQRPGAGPGAPPVYRVVSWIDSKATFGDDRTHGTQLDQQYRTYVNRYGPGLVIYWFGFIDDLHSSDEQVLLLDDFPAQDDIFMLPQTPSPPK